MKSSKIEKSANTTRGLHGLAALSFERLIRLKEGNKQNEFDKIIFQLLPDINGYIAKRLSAAVRNGNLPSGKYKVEDFTDELYVKAFEQIREVEDEKYLLPWLFEKADELLERTVTAEEENEHFFENIENYTSEEWKQMQRDFGSTSDEDGMLLAEFDSPTYPNYEYQLSDTFIGEDPENEWLENLNDVLGTDEIHQHIDMVLHKLPAPMRSVYDLAVNQRFEPYEIAKIKRISVYQVERYLREAKASLRKSITKRFK